MSSVVGTVSTPDGHALAVDVPLTFFSADAGSFTAPPRDGLTTGSLLVLSLNDGRAADARVTGAVPARPGAVVYGFALLSRPS